MAAVDRHGEAAAWRRPVSLAQVAGLGPGGFDARLREFLDEFYGSDKPTRIAALAEPPERLDAVKDTYLAAVAEHLSLRFGLPVPAWTDDAGRFLDHPFFAGGLEGLKAILLAQSPLAFRRRLLFVSADALSRPRDPDEARLTSREPSRAA